MPPLRVLIVSENISMRMGGESSIPFLHAKFLAQRGAEVWLACHARVETELRAAFPAFGARILVVPDTPLQRLLFHCGKALPPRLRDFFVDQAIHFSTQRRIRAMAVELARTRKIDVVFEPAPMTPKGLSFMYRVGVPVVIGPLCGGIDFPPAFAKLDSLITRALVSLGRHAAQLANRLVRGKIEADVLLAANASTVKALPAGHRGRVLRLFESGVDLDLWKPAGEMLPAADGTVRFAFSGRFADWKGIQYLIPAFAEAVVEAPFCRLDLIGGGELEGEVKTLIERYDLSAVTRVHGWVSRPEAARLVGECDVFVMPSLRECGGAAILEAMALGKPVIATNWGGPADYVDPGSGILVDPSSPSDFIHGLAAAMVRLANTPETRRALGAGGQRRVLQNELNWNAKTDRLLSILTDVAGVPEAPDGRL